MEDSGGFGMSEKKIVGITMGDPASIGPEITVKAFADKSLYDLCRPVVVGDACVMEAALPIVGHTEMKINPVKDVADAKFEYGTIDVLDMGLVDMDQLKRGEVSAMCGEAASDPMMIPLLLAFGLNEFSMSSSAILKARKMITGYSEAELQAVADKAMSFVSAKEIENFMRDFINQ